MQRLEPTSRVLKVYSFPLAQNNQVTYHGSRRVVIFWSTSEAKCTLGTVILRVPPPPHPMAKTTPAGRALASLGGSSGPDARAQGSVDSPNIDPGQIGISEVPVDFFSLLHNLERA
jgi:hypothetical protein